ncbi:MAG: hypothetical protein WD278_03880 [Pirellulales bacterium]
MAKRTALAALFALFASLCWFALEQAELRGASGDGGSTTSAVTVDLKTQLEKGLRARRDVEFAFIARVLELVDQGVLPRRTVQTAFNWARKKPTKKVQYFEFALRALARKRGIRI